MKQSHFSFDESIEIAFEFTKMSTQSLEYHTFYLEEIKSKKYLEGITKTTKIHHFFNQYQQ